jgi:hypothetical protein
MIRGWLGLIKTLLKLLNERYEMPFDGKQYFCARCGKAGFKSEMAARGHLSACQGQEGVLRDLVELRAAPPPPPAAARVAAPAIPALAELVRAARTVAPVLGAETKAEMLEQENARLRRQMVLTEKRANVATRYATNHVPHLLAVRKETSSVWNQLLTPQVKLALMALGLVLLLGYLKESESDLKSRFASKVGDSLISRIFS